MFRTNNVYNLHNELRSLYRLHGYSHNARKPRAAFPLLVSSAPSLVSGVQKSVFAKGVHLHSSYLDCFMTQHCDDLRDQEPCETLKSRQGRTEQEATIQSKEPFTLHALKWGPEEAVVLTKKQSMHYYTQMQMMRNIELIASELFRQRYELPRTELRTGHEASAIGIRAAMRGNDKVIMEHRSHGWAHLMGVSPFQIFCEMAGRDSGPSHGKGGMLHMYAHNFYGSNGISGSQVPIGAGIAFASKYAADGSACLTIYDEAACQQGRMLEAFSTSARWRLPSVFVCDSNVGTHAATRGNKHYKHSETIPGIVVDGMDALSVRSATEFAIDFAVEHGPIILELAGSTRTTDKEDEPDPIASFGELCMENNLLSKQQLELIDSWVYDRVNNAVMQALLEKKVDPSELTADIYAKCLESNIRGINCFNQTDSWMLDGPSV